MQPERVDLAIIGAGPAGLSAAREAARRGIGRLVVLERESEAGGTVRHCGHLGFGMLDLARLWTGPTYAAALRQHARGLDVRLGHAVTAIEPGGRLTVSTPGGERWIEAARILLATGIREMPRAARFVSGGRPFGVLTTGALQRFIYLHGRLPCRRPVVVGTELVSFSAILTLRHAGAKPVAILGEGERLDAPSLAGPFARLVLGVPVLKGVVIEQIEGGDRVEAVTVIRQGLRQRIACDGVIFSGGWVPEASLMRLHPAGVDPATGGPVVDRDLRTSDAALFAAGNVRFGVRSSGRCALEGRAAARRIVDDLRRAHSRGVPAP